MTLNYKLASPLHLETLKTNVSSWNFDVLTVPGDGNCFFHAVGAPIEQISKTDSCVANLEVLKSISVKLSSEDRIHYLRNVLANEFLGERRQHRSKAKETQIHTLPSTCNCNMCSGYRHRKLIYNVRVYPFTWYRGHSE